MNKKLNTIILKLITIVFCTFSANAQYIADEFHPNYVLAFQESSSLNIAPDARSVAMGKVGVATSPDANSQYWNPSKYAFAYSKGAIGLTYTPWFSNIGNDMFNTYLAGYWKVGYNDNQALSASLRYFSPGKVYSSDQSGITTQSLNLYEMAIDLGYSRKLSEKFSMGVAFRYIYSDLGFSDSYAGDQTLGASAFAADISGLFSTYPTNSTKLCQWSWGWNLSNIGTKISYNNGEDPAFLPTNFRTGTALTLNFNDHHNLAFSLDFNKLLVPTKPRESDFSEDTEGQQAYLDALEDWENMSSITGIFKSLTDAPGGLAEELREVSLSVGAEYNYKFFLLRSGYFHKYEKGINYHYFGVGTGVSFDLFKIEASYLITKQKRPFNFQPLYLSLSFNTEELMHMFGY